jgi:hypothetical protein
MRSFDLVPLTARAVRAAIATREEGKLSDKIATEGVLKVLTIYIFLSLSIGVHLACIDFF